MAVPVDELRLFVEPSPGAEPLTELFNVVEGLNPDNCSLSVRMKRSAHRLPSGERTNEGLDSIPRKRISLWK